MLSSKWFNLLFLSFLVTLCVVKAAESCTDLYPRNCKKWDRRGYCTVDKYKSALQTKCRKTCNFCADSKCVDLASTQRCEEWFYLGLCGEGKVGEMCSFTCGSCSDSDKAKCPSLTVYNGRFTSSSPNTNQLKVDMSGIREAGDELAVECDVGFQLMGRERVACQETGLYDGELGVCVRKNECEVPTYGTTYNRLDRYFLVSEAMSLKSNYVSPGTYAILVCTNGRKQQSFCSSFGTWLPPIKDCNDDTYEWDRWYEDNTISKRHSP